MRENVFYKCLVELLSCVGSFCMCPSKESLTVKGGQSGDALASLKRQSDNGRCANCTPGIPADSSPAVLARFINEDELVWKVVKGLEPTLV